MAISREEIMQVKGRGFLLNRGTECFSGRVVPTGGVFTAQQLRTIAACAEKYGNGKVAFSSRLSPEIVGIPYQNIPDAETLLAQEGLYFGGTGAKVRPITACKGTTCVYGNIDTQGLAKQLHERFYVGMGNVKLPHKFKIGIGGCPNSCMKPSLNDIGIEGHRPYAFDADKCRGCKRCAVAEGCPSKVVSRAEDGKSMPDSTKCLSCGVCIGKCPFEAVPKEAEALCRIYVGGTWGKKQRVGVPLKRMVPVSEAGDIVEKAILWYKENGHAKERFGVTIERLGMEAFEKALFSEDLLKRRNEIISAPIKE